MGGAAGTRIRTMGPLSLERGMITSHDGCEVASACNKVTVASIRFNGIHCAVGDVAVVTTTSNVGDTLRFRRAAVVVCVVHAGRAAFEGAEVQLEADLGRLRAAPALPCADMKKKASGDDP